jgi:NAD(P)-dependent dehydrogenase (short-subunit alcohol dehydrogenase family)
LIEWHPGRTVRLPLMVSEQEKAMSKKVVIVGATGTIGRAVAQALEGTHEVVRVGRNSGDLQVDITRSDSIRALFDKLGRVDAIVSTAGNVHFGPVPEMTAEQFRIGLLDKLLGQVDLALIGQHHLRDGGSITLTSGIVGHEPIRMGANASTVTGALEAFALAAAPELQRGQRINVVCPSVLTESLGVYGPFFPGFESVPAQRVAQAYVRSVDGMQTGRVYRVW